MRGYQMLWSATSAVTVTATVETPIRPDLMQDSYTNFREEDHPSRQFVYRGKPFPSSRRTPFRGVLSGLLGTSVYAYHPSKSACVARGSIKHDDRR
jgi:hypothetical protein